MAIAPVQDPDSYHRVPVVGRARSGCRAIGRSRRTARRPGRAGAGRLPSRRRAPGLTDRARGASGSGRPAGWRSRRWRSTRPTSEVRPPVRHPREKVPWRWIGRLHRRADRTLVPSTSSYDDLHALGVGDLHLWGRGVSLDLFGPGHRSVGPAPSVGGAARRRRASATWAGWRRRSRSAGSRRSHGSGGARRGGRGRSVAGVARSARSRGRLHRHVARPRPRARLRVAWTSSCTPASPRPSARRSRRPRPAASRWWPPRPAGRWTWSVRGRTGLLYDPSDAWSLRRAVATLVGDPALRRELAEEALTAVRHRSWAAVVDELVNVTTPVSSARRRTVSRPDRAG